MDIRVLSHREYVVVAMAQPFIMIMICLLVLCEITCCCNSVITQSACFLSSQQIVTMKYFHNCVGTEIIFSIALTTLLTFRHQMVHNIVLHCVYPAAAARCSQTSEIVSLDSHLSHVCVSVSVLPS